MFMFILITSYTRVKCNDNYITLSSLYHCSLLFTSASASPRSNYEVLHAPFIGCRVLQTFL